jgi:integrase
VPLSTPAVAVLDEAREQTGGVGLVFPSPTGKPISNATMSKLCKENNIGCVPHGMRSSFRDWCGETGVSRDLAEAALAHTIKGVESAYARSDLLERRRELMEKWGRYLQP